MTPAMQSTPGVPSDIARLLEQEALRINSPAFIADDPVQFPRRFSRLQDIEITALLTAVISWGRRPMILRDAGRMLSLMDNQPFHYMMERGYEDLDPGQNIHRTFFARDLQWFMRGLRSVYERQGSLCAFTAAIGAGQTGAPAWSLVDALGRIVADENGGRTSPHCLPVNLRTSALKRVNMALRWLVRDDGIVDMGVWDCIPQSKLFLPLDVHVGNTARQLGLLARKSNDRRSVEELTALMRTLRPDDPVLFDYALFGIGVTGKTVMSNEIIVDD